MLVKSSRALGGSRSLLDSVNQRIESSEPASAGAPQVVAAEAGLVTIVRVVGVPSPQQNGSGRRAPELPMQDLIFTLAEGGT